MKMLLIVNPCSGRIKIKGALFDILQTFCKAGYVVTTQMTTKRGNATEFASKAYAEGYDLVVCCGGDGTLNEVISGLMKGEKQIPLGYIPSGTTNDFARTLGLETDPIKAAKAIVNRKEEIAIDVGKFGNTKYFAYIASFGMFTSASYTTQQSAKNALGHMAYVFEGIANMGKIETLNISLDDDGKKYEGEYIYGGITNSTSVGGMFKFNPETVNLDDGLYEVLMIKKPKTPNDFMKIVTCLTTGDLSDPTVFDFCKASKISLNMPENVTWALDGESAKGKTNVTIENLHEKIHLIK